MSAATVDPCPGDAVEVQQIWLAGLPPFWRGGYKLVARRAYPSTGEFFVVEATGGEFAGCQYNFGEENVRKVPS